MSHSTVLVIGEDPEALLAPYDENLDVEPYREYEDGNPEDHCWVQSVRRGAEHHRNATGLDAEDRRSVFAGRPEATVEEQSARYAEDAEWAAKLGEHPTWETVVKLYDEKYPGGDGDDPLLYDPETDRAYAMSTYNPKSKWDWYQLGGRWTGFFRLKPGASGSVGRSGLMTPPAGNGLYDSARKGDIDWDAIRVGHEADARAEFTKVQAALVGVAPLMPWSVYRETYSADINKARAAYRAQPALGALRGARLYADDPFVDYCLGAAEPETAYVTQAGRNRTMTFAVLDHEGWHERGRMGWFGAVSDEKDDWPDTWHRLVDRAPDDSLFSVYDVHI